MPFALGVAIGELFRNIAEILRGGIRPVGGSLPTPGGGLPTPPPQTPPPVVVVPPSPTPAPTPTVPVPCDVLSYADQLTLYALQYRDSRSQGGQAVQYPTVVQQDDEDMLSITGATLVDASDYFRFRAISTADSVPVSFFGRVRVSRDVIVPFNHVLQTSTPNTIFETITRTGPGLLLGTAASVPIGSITTGAVNAIGEIGRLSGNTFTPHTVLFSGQLDDQQALSNTLSVPTAPVNRGQYFLMQDAGPTTFQFEYDITPNPGRKVRILSAGFDFELGAASAPRYPRIRYFVGSQIVYYSACDVGGVASQEGRAIATMGGTTRSEFSTNTTNSHQYNIAVTDSLYFTEPFIVYFGMDAVSAGDSIFDSFLMYEET